MSGAGIRFVLFLEGGWALFWLLTRDQQEMRSGQTAWTVEYRRGLAEMSALLFVWTATAGVVLLMADLLGLAVWIGWSGAVIVALAELPAILRLGRQYPWTRLPTEWRPPGGEPLLPRVRWRWLARWTVLGVGAAAVAMAVLLAVF